MLICQISDLHIKHPGELAYQRVDTAAYLRRAVAYLNTLQPRPDAVLITGDLVDRGDAQEYAHLASLLAPLQIPYYLTPGNHDDRATLRAAFPDHGYLRQHDAFILYTVDIGALTVIALDTLDSPRHGGRVCDVRLAWLEQQLAEAAGRPVLILMHHPPFVTGIEHMDEIGIPADDCARLAALVQRHPNVERILCGHLHRPIHARFGGTIASTCPSPAHQVALDLRAGGPSSFILEPPGYQLHQWQPSIGMVTHTGVIGQYPGEYGEPHPFHDASGTLID